jgi:hypothetical protein
MDGELSISHLVHCWRDLQLDFNSDSINGHPWVEVSFTLHINNRVARNVTLFQWYPQTKEILLNLSMKCWNSAFNTQGLTESNNNICIGRSSEKKYIYIVAVEALRKKEDETQFTTEIEEKLVWVPVSFVL